MRNKWLETFLQESEELLAGIEESALALGSSAAGDETINQIFRSFHTIKGSGSMCGLTRLAEFTHHVESLLDKVRAGLVPTSQELADVVLAASDHIRALLAAEQGGDAVDPAADQTLIARVAGISGQVKAATAESSPAVEASAAPAAEGGMRTWQIFFRPDPSLLSSGGNPILLFRELRDLGTCEIVADTSAVPPLEALRPELCYLSWKVRLTTAADENAIRDVFMFVEDGAELKIQLEPAAAVAQTPGPLKTADNPGSRRANPQASLARESTVRVPASRLDRLVNLVGELVMNQSRLSAIATRFQEFSGPVQEMERLVAELRDDVLGIRMLPIGTIFGRFRRLVHDLSAELGKEVDLVTEGAETELDKSILDQLSEPLVHLLRNCIDHGIEPPEVRESSGKPRRGTIVLRASHVGSNVVISIDDDGRGIDRSVVRAKAVEKQLIAPDAVLHDREILNLILLPGFSTARQVTNVSGRGVGMDVVKKQIDILRGTLSISSQQGSGTSISLNLPLTLAIIEGLIVSVGEDEFILPMSAVMENVELTRAQRQRNNGRNVVAVRGDLVPYIDLRALFQVPGEAPSIEKIVIVHHEDQRVGLVVDRVLGTHQTVLQSLGRFFRNVDVVSGGTIMGDGRVALVMDIAAVVRFADQHDPTDQSQSHVPPVSTNEAGIAHEV